MLKSGYVEMAREMHGSVYLPRVVGFFGTFTTKLLRLVVNEYDMAT